MFELLASLDICFESLPALIELLRTVGKAGIFECMVSILYLVQCVQILLNDGIEQVVCIP